MRIIAINMILILCCPISAYAELYPDIPSVDRVHSDLKYLQKIVEEYKRQNHTYPSTADWQLELIEHNFLKSSLRDPWGYEYHYARKNEKYEIWSLGRDGAVGGIGEAFDYSSLTTRLNMKHRELLSQKHRNIVTVKYIILLFVTACGVLLAYAVFVKKKPFN